MSARLPSRRGRRRRYAARRRRDAAGPGSPPPRSTARAGTGRIRPPAETVIAAAVVTSASSARATDNVGAPLLVPTGSAYLARRRPSYRTTTVRASISPAYSSWGEPDSGSPGVPAATETLDEERAGRAQASTARATSSSSSARSPRAGHAVKSTRDVSAQESVAVRCTRCGTATDACRAGPDSGSVPATTSTVPVTRPASSAAPASRVLVLRRSRSVGWAHTVQASHSL